MAEQLPKWDLSDLPLYGFARIEKRHGGRFRGGAAF